MPQNPSLDLMAYEHAPIGIVSTRERIIKSCNATFAEMVGYEKSELLERSFRMLYASTMEFENVRDIGLKPLQEGGIYTDERLVTRKDGAQIWCRFRAQSLSPRAPLREAVMSFALISDKTAQVSLSPRDREVLAHVAKGRTSREIAVLMNRSPRTIEDIRSRLLKKFRMKNAAELLAHLTRIAQ